MSINRRSFLAFVLASPLLAALDCGRSVTRSVLGNSVTRRVLGNLRGNLILNFPERKLPASAPGTMIAVRKPMRFAKMEQM